MQLKINEKFPVEFSEAGTYISFEDNTFYAVMADEFWSDTELKLFKNKKMLIQIVNKSDQLIFLLSVDGVIETSDFYFNIHDEEAFVKADCYNFCFILLDKNSVINGMKTCTLNKATSAIISQILDQQQSSEYDEEVNLKKLAALQKQFEPFELQPFALCEESH
ncbi:hypothetical protein [Dielma fastidiosa]|uniref:Uncharacterized protein n=1 Tax=Dielma fastidiosa TaxID=1034346 RepID=A0A318L4M2_9FIRM|nr:hypothetical protein [Dielma fastidiosa]PXX80423.1 hypothetical protein DES51_10314 [Dielma fastidiosa]HAH93948.1 hypothetical protein [Dielma fastidiosa]